MELQYDAGSLEQVLMEKAGAQKLPINGSLELLPLCNMNCKMCYIRVDRAELDTLGQIRGKEAWIALGQQLKDAGVLFLLLTGGEPLLHPEFKEIYLALRKMGFLLTINTNGTLIDEAWADFFQHYPPRRINITLYGASPEAYEALCQYPQGFHRVVHAIKLLKDRGIAVKGAQSVTALNRQELEPIFDLGRQLDIPITCDTYMMPSGKARRGDFSQNIRLSPQEAAAARVEAFQQTMGKDAFLQYTRNMIQAVQTAPQREPHPAPMTCLAGSCSFTINWQGELKPCSMMNSPSCNVFQLGFQQAWHSLRRQIDAIYLNPACSACPKRVLCRTCAACAFYEAGAYDALPTYMCAYTDKTLRLLQEHLEKEQP